jgi:tRNA/rRNA methyltransferase
MMETALANIRIILVEPAGPLNVGAIARAMKNMGLGNLVLVSPQCDPLGPEARQMAVHAGDVLSAALVVNTLPEALRGCQWAIATTARPRTLAINLEHPKTILPWLLEVAHQGSAALIFGPEDRGLDNTELHYAQRFLSIPTNPAYPSLNLAQAVAVCCYELYQAAAVEHRSESQQQTQAAREGPQDLDSIQNSKFKVQKFSAPLPASLDSLESYYQHLESLLLKIGYLYPHTADSRMKKFRHLLSRAMPSVEEVALLRGTLSQVEWAIQNLDLDKKADYLSKEASEEVER